MILNLMTSAKMDPTPLDDDRYFDDLGKSDDSWRNDSLDASFDLPGTPVWLSSDDDHWLDDSDTPLPTGHGCKKKTRPKKPKKLKK